MKHCWLFVLGFVFTLGGCSTVVLEDNDRGDSHYRLGLVKIVVPETDKRISAYKIQSLGLLASNGFVLGWQDDEKVLIPLKEGEGDQPYEATCAIVIVLRSQEELDHTHQIVKGLEGENICVASF